VKSVQKNRFTELRKKFKKLNKQQYMSETKRKSPWWFVPSLYFAQGIPYFLVNMVPVVVFKDMGISNADIARYTSLLYLPWTLKMLWGPFVDTKSTKRNWVLYTQLIMAALFLAFGFALHLPHFFVICLVILGIIAFISATHDIAADGFYMIALSKENQSAFAGIRSTFYRVSNFFCNSFVVWFAGYLIANSYAKDQAWSFAYNFAAILFALIFLYHKFLIPYPAQDGNASAKALENDKTEKPSVKEAFLSFFKQPGILAIIFFILTFRMGEAFLIKLAVPFFKDVQGIGGLGFSTEQVGFIYLFGVTAIIIGGILGGLVVAKYGLKKLIWYMALIINIPTIMYTIMAFIRPESVATTIPLVAVEQFSYGFGYTALMIYMMQVSKGQYKTTHFAIATGISALGMMIPGIFSGDLQTAISNAFPGLGYQYFFLLTVILGIPGIITLFFIPFEKEEAV
jgi:MFS transporter, PAT family, beta-lactamase induction signal transducer AmpG